VRVPAEWETQQGVWLCYPTCREHWGLRLEAIQKFVCGLTAEILQFQPVFMLFNEGDPQECILELFKGLPFPAQGFMVPHNDLWVRDYGPFFIQHEGALEVHQFRFNSWGEKFPPWDLEATFSQRLAQKFNWRFLKSELTIEGGAFDFNGGGIALTTRPCLMNPNRNPGLEESAMNREICRHLNLDELIVLPEGLMGDHTDGHVDNLVRFIDEKSVIMPTICSGDVNEENLLNVRRQLQDWRHPREGWALKILEAPYLKPRPFGKNWLPLSYMNFIYVNGGIFYPAFGEANQAEAQQFFESCFPKRQVRSIDCNLLIEEGGALHCMTRQQPRPELA
jgi:agmatine deiminase